MIVQINSIMIFQMISQMMIIVFMIMTLIVIMIFLLMMIVIMMIMMMVAMSMLIMVFMKFTIMIMMIMMMIRQPMLKSLYTYTWTNFRMIFDSELASDIPWMPALFREHFTIFFNSYLSCCCLFWAHNCSNTQQIIFSQKRLLELLIFNQEIPTPVAYSNKVPS